MLLRKLCLIGLAVLLTSCATSSPREKQIWPWPDPPVVEEPVQTGAPTPTPLPAAPAYPRTAEQASGQAVTALMQQARSDLDAGQPARAASALERAVRIEPRNPFVWSLLGKTYLALGDAAQAENVCVKSNALARGNPYVQIDNWQTIESARQAQGDRAGADAAAEARQRLQQQLAGG